MIDLIFAIFLISFLFLILLTNVEFFFFLIFVSVLIFSALRLDPSTPIVSLFGIALYIKDIFFFSLIAFIIVFFFKKIFEGEKIYNSNHFKIPFFIFFIITIKVFLSWPLYGTSAFLSAKHMVYFFSNVLFFSIYPLSNNRLWNFYKNIFAVSIIYSLVGIFRIFGFLPSIYSNTSSSLNFATNYNSLRYFDRSDLEVLIVGALIIFIVFLKSSKNKFLLLSTLCFFSALILFSNTRSAMLSYIFVIGFFMLRNNPFFNKINISLSILIIFILAQLSNPLIFLESIFGSAFSIDNLFGEQSTLIFRNIVSLAYISHMNSLSYVVGMNFGDAPLVFPELFFTNIPGHGFVGLHSTYVELIYYFGLPLFIFLMILYRKIFENLSKLRKNNRETKLSTISFLSSLFYMIFFLFWTFDQFSGMVIGLSLATIKNFKNDINSNNLD